MIRYFATLFVLTAVLGCSTPTPKTSTPTSFEDSFRRKHEMRRALLDKAHVTIDVPALNGEFVWDDEFGNTTAIVSPDGHWLLTGQRSFADVPHQADRGIVSLWSLTDPEAHQPKIVPADFVTASIDWLAFTPDSSQFFVFRRPMGNYKPGTLKRYDRVTGNELQTISSSLAAQTGGVSPDGRRLVAVTPNTIEVWNIVDGQKIGSIPLGAPIGVDTIRFTPDGRLLFASCLTNEIRVFDLEHGKFVATIPVNNKDASSWQSKEPKNCFALSPDGKILAMAHVCNNILDGKPGGRIEIYEIGTWRLLREIKPTDPKKVVNEINGLCFSTDGTMLYCTGYMRSENRKETILKTYLGELDLSKNNGAWTEIPYETLPLHPIGKRLLMYPDSSEIMLTAFYEKMGLDFNIQFKKE